MSFSCPRAGANARKHLILLPTVDVVQADVHEPETLLRLVIRLRRGHQPGRAFFTGRRGDPYGPEFARVHVELPKKIVEACKKKRVQRLVHMSALHAHPEGPSQYLRSKGDGEAWVFSAQNDLAVTAFRPSVIFGAEDRFLNTFAWLAALAARAPSPQPRGALSARVRRGRGAVFRGEPLRPGQRRQALRPRAGRSVYALRELATYAGTASGHPRPVIGLSDRLSFLQAWAMEFKPGTKLMSRDNYNSMKVDSVCDGPFPFSIQPTPLEVVAPDYLHGASPRSRYSWFRYKAGR